MILQTRSGRNLGPCTLADDELAKFALSDDMVRIKIENEEERYLVFAFLKTTLGQRLIKRGRSGSVIDHLAVPDVEAVPVPVFPERVTAQVSGLIRDAIERRQRGRTVLGSLISDVNRETPSDEGRAWTWWENKATQCRDRLDAGHHHPAVKAARAGTKGAGGIRLGELAKAALPLRYKRYYVEAGHGRAIVSGRQLLQPEPINLRYVSDRSFKRPADYEIHTGYTVFGAVGRAEGRQAWPALITGDRDGWLASNDVMRLIPRAGVEPGAVWLAVAAAASQVQIKALSFGSVVDHMNPWDVETVIVPTIKDAIAMKVEKAWLDLAKSTNLIKQAVVVLEDSLEMLGSE
ncbi:hypothetical protein DVS77_31810 [Mycolicibacterium moriokaense]|nr:hypothetical protein DVS77_31810 [Mycolicibacterium moriokaense]